eukprot:Opistho-2@7176
MASSFVRGMAWPCVWAFILRVLLFMIGMHDYLGDRIEFSTPATSAKRVREGVFLRQQGISPYSGGTVHATPLVLGTFSVADCVGGTWAIYTLYAFCDVLVGVCLYRIAKQFRLSAKRAESDDRASYHTDVSDDILMPREDDDGYARRVACMYLYNPIVVAGCISLSTALFTNTALAVALAAACTGHAFVVGVACAMMASESLHLVVLWPAIALVAAVGPVTRLSAPHRHAWTRMACTRMFTCVAGLAAASCALVWWSWVAAGGTWDGVHATHGFALRVDDLTPNIGLYWYFFVEIFDHFRSFFLGVFHLHAFIYAAMLTPRLQHANAVCLCEPLLVCGYAGSFVPLPVDVDVCRQRQLLLCGDHTHRRRQFSFAERHYICGYSEGLGPAQWAPHASHVARPAIVMMAVLLVLLRVWFCRFVCSAKTNNKTELYNRGHLLPRRDSRHHSEGHVDPVYGT